MGILVKLLSRGIGLASEAVHHVRSQDDNSASSSTRPSEHVEVADEATAAELVRSGRAERVVDYADEQRRDRNTAYPADEKTGLHDNSDYSDDSDSGSDVDTEIGQDEAVWELDEAAERVAPP